MHFLGIFLRYSFIVWVYSFIVWVVFFRVYGGQDHPEATRKREIDFRAVHSDGRAVIAATARAFPVSRPTSDSESRNFERSNRQERLSMESETSSVNFLVPAITT
jgi:hypothetical protein